jgi:hypothetical protein
LPTAREILRMKRSIDQGVPDTDGIIIRLFSI